MLELLNDMLTRDAIRESLRRLNPDSTSKRHLYDIFLNVF